MFCPNCGNNCDNANFCPKCGTKLAQQTEQLAVWSIGQPCPHCGGTKLNGKWCAFCGAQLMVDTVENQQKEISNDIPCGKYKGVTSAITLYDTACVINNRVGLFKKYETRIPYAQITSVVYVRPFGNVTPLGYLLIRWEENKDLPIPPDRRFSGDKTTVTISEIVDTLFYHIYCMLKAIVPTSAEFTMIAPQYETFDEKSLLESADLEYYYRKYAPHRVQAVDALCRRTGAEKKTAKDIVDSFFDMRQKAVYTEDPTEAIRDLNRIVDEIQRKKEEELAEIERRRQEEDTLRRLEEIAERRDRP